MALRAIEAHVVGYRIELGDTGISKVPVTHIAEPSWLFEPTQYRFLLTIRGQCERGETRLNRVNVGCYSFPFLPVTVYAGAKFGARLVIAEELALNLVRLETRA